MPPPTRQSVLDFGLPPPVAATPENLVEQVVPGAGLLFYRAHGLGLDHPLSLRSISSTIFGSPPSVVPTGLAEGVTYYARPTTSDAFQLAAAVSPASAIATFADAGVGRFGFLLDPAAALDLAISRAWTIVQSDCTAHGGNVDAPILTDAAASLAVRFYVAILCAGDANKAESYAGLTSLYAEVYEPKLAAYFSGVEVRGAVDQTPGVADNGPRLIGPTTGPFRRPVTQQAFETLRGPFGVTLGPERDRV